MRNQIGAGAIDACQCNILFMIIGARIVAVGVLGYNVYQAEKKPSGMQINVGPTA